MKSQVDAVKKIKELNKYVGDSLSLTYYTVGGWEISSYKDETLFNDYPYKTNKSFKRLVNTAYKAMLKERNKK